MKTALVTQPAAVPAARSWEIDAGRSTVAFELRHFHLATVGGRFTRFEGLIGDAGAHGSVEVASVETGNDIRDARLRSEFFDASSSPRLTFETHEPLGSSVAGRLTIRGVTLPVTFSVERDEDGDEIRIAARATISRKAFGLDWAALRDAGRLIVGDKVRIRLDLVAQRVPPA